MVRRYGERSKPANHRNDGDESLEFIIGTIK